MARNKKTAQWAVKNPFKVSAGAFVIDQIVEYVKFSPIEAEYAAGREKRAREKNIQDHPITQTFKDICKEHGLNDVIIDIDRWDTRQINMAAQSVGGKRFIDISQRAWDQLCLEFSDAADQERKIPSPLMRHLKALIIHEIKHLLCEDTRANNILTRLCSEKTRDSAAAFLALAISMKTTEKSLSLSNHFPFPLHLRACISASLGFLGAQAFLTFKKNSSIHLSELTAIPKLSRIQERRADDYVIETAFAERNPALLDDFAELCDCKWKEEDETEDYRSTHPPTKERAHLMRSAATQLREEMRTGRPAGIVVSHDCSPF